MWLRCPRRAGRGICNRWEALLAHPVSCPTDGVHLKLRIDTEDNSPGLQVIDVVLWLFKRIITDRDIGPQGARLLNRVFQRGWQNDLSFDGVGNAAEKQLEEIWNAPVSEEQAHLGAELLAREQDNRMAALKAYLAETAGEAGSLVDGG